MNERRSNFTTQEQIEKRKLELKENINKDYEIQNDKNSKQKMGNLIFGVILVFLIGAMIKVTIENINGEVPSLFGYQIYRVETGSMSPTLPTGSIIISKKVNNNTDIKVDDIITFKHDGDIITHRIVEEIEENGIVYFKTKGDNEVNSVDPWEVYFEDILAVYKFKI